MDSTMEFDLGPLTWVKGEIDNAFEAAATELGNWNGEDETPLKAAAAYLHQVNGALQIVELQGVSLVCGEAERLLADLEARPESRSREAGDLLIRGIRTLRSYLDGLMDGVPNAELALMPAYIELARQRGGEVPAPSELFYPDTSLRVRREQAELPLDDEARIRALRASRSKYQKGLLQLLQNKDAGAGLQLMDEAVREVESLAPGSAQYTFWWASGGLMEALKRGSLEPDFWIKRLCGRIDMQMRRLMEGSKQLAERLFRDVLYYLAQDGSGQGRPQEARQLFSLERLLPIAPLETVAEDARGARLAGLRDALNGALEHWIRAASGRRDSLEACRAALRRGHGIVQEMDSPPLQSLIGTLQDVADALPAADDITGNEALQLEMAVAILLAQRGCEHGGRPDDAFATHANVQAEYLKLAADPEADLSGMAGDPYLEDLSRQARDRLLLAQVSQAIQAKLQQVEEVLERYFRDPAARADLPLVPSLMRQVQGDFGLLHLDVAADLIKTSMDQFDLLADSSREIGQDELNWVADAVSTLGLYVEVLRRGRNDPGALRALLAQPSEAAQREESVEEEIDAAFDQLADLASNLPEAADPQSARAEMRSVLSRLLRDADLVGDRGLREQVDALIKTLDGGVSLAELQAAVTKFTGQAQPGEGGEPHHLVTASAEAVDAELLQIYLEEAGEVLRAIDASLAILRGDPLQREDFVSIRRGFHTLKGSGRMVGLDEPAEIAWEVEQALNDWIRAEKPVDEAMLDFLGQTAEAFKAWVQQLAEQGSLQAEGGAIVATARRLRGISPPKSEAGAEAEAAPSVPAAEEGDETFLSVGEHRVPAQLLQIFLDEAGQRLADLARYLQVLNQTPDAGAWEGLHRSAHTLAGIARTTGFSPLADAAHALEDWAEHQGFDSGISGETGATLERIQARLAEMVAAIRSGNYPASFEELAGWLAAMRGTRESAAEAEASTATEMPPEVTSAVPEAAETIQLAEQAPADELDADLLPIFLAEAEELLPRVGEGLRQWRSLPASAEPRQGLQRALHTLKGSARMAGAMHLGDMAHHLETRIIEQGMAEIDEAFLDDLQVEFDRIAEVIDRLRSPVPAASAETVAEPVRPVQAIGIKASAEVLDTLINEAGEVSIARSRLENVLYHARMTAQELTANVDRLRGQLRELEMQAETQAHSRLADMDSGEFDPLEFDRYTRLQELTRLMAESVDDVSTAQENLLAGLGEADEALVHQGRMARSLQQELMHIRMVPLSSQAERLHRIVRQSSAELGRQARLSIDGGQTEVDRTILDKVMAPLEHLLRNAVAHGIEGAEARHVAGKPEEGHVRLAASQEGHEFVLVIEDDGAGVNLDKVRRRGEALGWLKPDENVSRERLESLLFMPGFSTAEQVTQVAGRGVGLDVVRSEIAGIGGRVRLDTEAGRGTRFTIRLPITLALTQVVLAVAGNRPYALPASTVVLVKEVKAEEWEAIAAAGQVELEGQVFPLRSLAELTGQDAAPLEGKFRSVLLLRSGAERLALRVDRLAGNLEAVVKPIGPQLSRIVGIAGVTLLGDGRVALILDPFVLMERVPKLGVETVAAEMAAQPPLILIVDDSLTVRKITGKLLHRAGYRIATAKDGTEALEALQDERPAAMLLDIEMPRMDGFEVARHVRADAQTKDLPIIMITSRSAEKHRQHALDLGVNAYMGKPFKDEELLAELARQVARSAAG